MPKEERIATPIVNGGSPELTPGEASGLTATQAQAVIDARRAESRPVAFLSAPSQPQSQS